MYQPPKCPYSYFSKALEFYLRAIFPCEYPQYSLDILIKHASIKKKCIIVNENHFMTKELSKAIMKRSKLLHRFVKEKRKVYRKAYTTQKNNFVNILGKTKREYFANTKIKNIADNKKISPAVKPFFSDKINHRETINLIYNVFTLSNDEEIAKTFNKYFSNITENL